MSNPIMINWINDGQLFMSIGIIVREEKDCFWLSANFEVENKAHVAEDVTTIPYDSIVDATTLVPGDVEKGKMTITH